MNGTRRAWTQERYESGQKITYPRLDPGSTASKQTSDFWMADGSYVRLKNAEFGYTISRPAFTKIGATKVRAYVNGLNLITWDNYPVKIKKKKFSMIRNLGNNLYLPCI